MRKLFTTSGRTTGGHTSTVSILAYGSYGSYGHGTSLPSCLHRCSWDRPGSLQAAGCSSDAWDSKHQACFLLVSFHQTSNIIRIIQYMKISLTSENINIISSHKERFHRTSAPPVLRSGVSPPGPLHQAIHLRHRWTCQSRFASDRPTRDPEHVSWVRSLRPSNAYNLHKI